MCVFGSSGVRVKQKHGNFFRFQDYKYFWSYIFQCHHLGHAFPAKNQRISLDQKFLIGKYKFQQPHTVNENQEKVYVG